MTSPDSTEILPRPAVPGVDVGALLGRGGFAAVYRGRHRALDTDVAVKIVETPPGDASAVERVLREARLMARLDHPNLLRIHDAGMLGASIYLVLELMDGGSLLGLRKVTAQTLTDLAQQLLAGLQALHKANVLHRDVKPANCLIRQSDRRVKLADLGIAVEQVATGQITQTVAGTLPFMAPELLERRPRFGPRSDLYALGMTLACLALEDDPFPRGSMTEILDWIRTGPRPRLSRSRSDLPPGLAALIDRMLASAPEDRPENAAQALAALTASPVPVVAAGLPGAPPTAATIGPWVLGDRVYSDRNWRVFAVTHGRTGAAARLGQLQSTGPLAGHRPLILASAARASRFDHPGLVPVIDWGIQDELAYIVTRPYGQSLWNLVKSGGPLEETEALEVVAALADVLAFFHERGLVYQVVDPGGAQMGPDARSVHLAWPMYCVEAGTPTVDADGKRQRAFVPQWAAPEAARKEGLIAPSVDIYGLGEILYFCLAGVPAYGGDAREGAIMLAKLGEPPDLRERRPDVTGPTARLVAELLNPDPARRPSSAAAVRDEVAGIARRLRGG